MNNTTLSVRGKISKKEIRKLVFEKLSGALSEFKAGIKEKKFSRNLNKATKLFAADIVKTISKKEKIKKPVKKKKVTEKVEIPVK